ncbi:helix-hairpin-helix domain-containing protein [uncultured Dokdonia sp.]|uniref:helix-hairpin-helix domain-containing protein n=1 Tax=uncultured Dokdonia sp. TaxID=575653 RepID=UPI00261E20FB|nr:helix-hairpin-helix domain-containing protein [uncultured Dokdonia sp.]
MNNLKSHFFYDRQKRSGILVFIGIILILISISFWYQPSQDIAISEEEQLEVLAFQKQIDSLKVLAIENNKPKRYPFNPNYITDYKGYTLGMNLEEVDRLHRFRESGKWINSIADFKQVTKVSDSLLDIISPYFKFPDWVTNPKPRKKYVHQPKWKTYDQKKDLNKITLDALLVIEGVDEVAADKILRHIRKIGGYQVDGQLYDVYGVSTKQKRAVLNEYTVKEKPTIHYINVNTATASDLATIPLLNFDLAKEIVDYRLLHEGVKTLEELSGLDGMTDYKFARIKLYLSVK